MVNLTKLWRFKRKDSSWVEAEPRLLVSSVYQTGNIKLRFYRYELSNGVAVMTRIHIEAGENVGFVLDKIIAKEDVCVYTDFWLENKDAKVWCNVADKHRLVIRNGVKAMKYFRLCSVMDDKDVMDTAGLLMPYAIGSDLGIGYSMYEGLYDFGKEHFACFGYCISELNDMTWHFYSGKDTFWIYPNNKSEDWQLELQLPIIKIIDRTNSFNSMTINMENGERL